MSSGTGHADPSPGRSVLLAGGLRFPEGPASDPACLPGLVVTEAERGEPHAFPGLGAGAPRHMP